MTVYTARKTAPTKNDKHYYSNENIFYACGYGMPNCTAYAWGRLFELTGKKYMSLNGNAEDWFNSAAGGGLKTGQTPRLGAIACYGAGKIGDASDGAGHVAVVEEIKPNGDIVTSNSAWRSTEFYLKEVTKESGYMYASDRPLLGFIYCDVEYESTVNSSTSSATSEKIYTVKKGDSLWGIAQKELGNGTRYTDIKKWNGLNSNMIYPGQKLKLYENKSASGTQNSTNVTESTTAVVKTGAKISLNNTKCYSSETVKDPYGTKSGLFYLWDNVIKNGRIRITNSAARVGVVTQVTCWIKVGDFTIVN